MRYSVQTRDRIYVKRYGCLSFPKNISKNLIGKYSQTPPDLAKQSATDTLKTVSKKKSKQLEKQLVIWLVIKLLKTSQKSQNLNFMTE